MGSTTWRQLLEHTSKCLSVSHFYTISDRWQDGAIVHFQQEVSGFEPGVFPLHELLHTLPLHGFSSGKRLHFLPQSKNMQVRLIADPDLPTGVNVSMYGCRLLSALHPMSAGIGSSPPPPWSISGVTNAWVIITYECLMTESVHKVFLLLTNPSGRHFCYIYGQWCFCRVGRCTCSEHPQSSAIVKKNVSKRAQT